MWMSEEQKEFIKSAMSVRAKLANSGHDLNLPVKVATSKPIIAVKTVVATDENNEFSGLDIVLADNLVPTVFTSHDIRKSKQYDYSAKQMPQSELISVSGGLCVYTNVDRSEYCAPIDRVARFYTPTAVGLTMKITSRVAKHLTSVQKTSKKIIGFSIAATAPDALKATQRLNEVEENGNISKLLVTKKKNKLAPIIDIPSTNSPLAMREEHRLLRSVPEYTIIKPNFRIPRNTTDSFGEGNIFYIILLVSM